MELLEGVGESSSPPHCSGGAGSGGGGGVILSDIRNDVYNRLIDNGNEEALSNPEFRELLDAHFDRLPVSYGLDVNVDRPEDVLLHRKLLAMAKDPEKRLVFHVRHLENFWTKSEGDEDQLAQHVWSLSIWEHAIIHEVILSTRDRPKLLSQIRLVWLLSGGSEMSALLSDIGLNIREAHVFSTTDGYSLDVFVVDGWNSKDVDSLHKAIEEAIDKNEGSWSGSSPQFPLEKTVAAQVEPGNWEIDRRLLKIGERIASGSFGDLYRGVYLGQDVAVKVLRSEHLTEASGDEFAQEVAILREVQHENVVRFIGACTESPNLCIVTEYMPRGSLYNYVHRNRKNLKLSELLRFAIDVSKGMEYLHNSNIIHRDLKTANLLMDTRQVVKVADFGVARFLHQEGVMTAETGTYRWMAPEVINHQPYDQKVDVFSFAIVLWELVTAKVPYENMTPLQAALGVRQGLRPELPENTNPKLLDLIRRCWDTAPVTRPPFSVIKIELEELLQNVQDASISTNSSGR